jgi:hypothetical protein
VTEFYKWRQALGLSIDEAAEVLGKSKMMVYYLDRGHSPRGECVPQFDTRCLMSVLASGQRPEPWPVETKCSE